MKIVTIPSNSTPFYEPIINGVKYRFPAGATIQVPDEIAEFISNNNDMLPPQNAPKPPVIPIPDHAGMVLTSTDNGYEWRDIPKATEDDLGVVKIGDGLKTTTAGVLSLKAATKTKRGGVFAGEAPEEATEDNVVSVVNSLIETLVSDAEVLKYSNALTMGAPGEDE